MVLLVKCKRIVSVGPVRQNPGGFCVARQVGGSPLLPLPLHCPHAIIFAKTLRRWLATIYLLFILTRKDPAVVPQMATEKSARMQCSCTDDEEDRKYDIISATKHGHEECVQKLIAQGCDLEVTDLDWPMYGPVAIAAGEGYTRLVEILLATGMDVNGTIAGQDGRACPLVEACLYGHMETVEMLIGSGANPNGIPSAEPPVNILPENGQLAAMKLLVNASASVNLTYDESSDGGGPALFKAASKGHVEIVDYLISIGTDLNIPTRRGFQLDDLTCDQTVGHTALMAACRSRSRGNAECVQLLIRAGAEINAISTSTNRTPHKSALAFASAKENKVIMEMLLVANAEVVDECEDCKEYGTHCRCDALPSFLCHTYEYRRTPDVNCVNLPYYLVHEYREILEGCGWDEETVSSELRNYETFLPLREICRKKIHVRHHLVGLINPRVDPNGYRNLFIAVSRLPLPDNMKDFLLFNIKLQSPWEPLPTP